MTITEHPKMPTSSQETGIHTGTTATSQEREVRGAAPDPVAPFRPAWPEMWPNNETSRG